MRLLLLAILTTSHLLYAEQTMNQYNCLFENSENEFQSEDVNIYVVNDSKGDIVTGFIDPQFGADCTGDYLGGKITEKKIKLKCATTYWSSTFKKYKLHLSLETMTGNLIVKNQKGFLVRVTNPFSKRTYKIKSCKKVRTKTRRSFDTIYDIKY